MISYEPAMMQFNTDEAQGRLHARQARGEHCMREQHASDYDSECSEQDAWHGIRIFIIEHPQEAKDVHQTTLAPVRPMIAP